MSVYSPSVAELEAKVLNGNKVTPQELAEARANEDAARRVAELEEQRRQAEALNERTRQALTALDAAQKQFSPFFKESNRIFEDSLQQITAAVLTYCDRAFSQNEQIVKYRAKHSNAQGIEPSAIRGTASDAEGHSHCGDVTARWVSSWKRDVEGCVADAIKLALENEAKLRRRQL